MQDKYTEQKEALVSSIFHNNSTILTETSLSFYKNEYTLNKILLTNPLKKKKYQS